MTIPNIKDKQNEKALVQDSVFDICAIASKTAKPVDTRAVMRELLLLNDGECYKQIEKYLLVKGVEGSKQFDHAYAIQALLLFDETYGMRLNNIKKTQGKTNREFYDDLVIVLRKLGMRVEHGRILGPKDAEMLEAPETPAMDLYDANQDDYS